MNYLLHFIDVFGTFIFSLSGAVIGVKQHFDIFGVFVIALVTAVGGGVIRDICLSDTPPAGLINIDYIIGICAAIVIVSFFQKVILSFQKPAVFFDALGLGFFAAFGANKTYQHSGSIQLAIILGCVSAIGGGIMRDVLTDRKPMIFTQELYASAAIVGACIELLGSTGTIDGRLSIWLSILVTITIRLLALRFSLKLPSIKSDRL